MTSSTRPVDIRPDHLEVVQDILLTHLPAGFKVWVFGSRANWTTKDSSDLDLAVEGAARLDHKAMVELAIAFEESNLPYTVDVVDLNAVSNAFKQIVEDQKVLLPLRSAPEKVNGAWREVTLDDSAKLIRDSVSPSAMGDALYIGLEHIGEGTLSLLEHGVASSVTSTKARFQRGDILFGKLRPYFRKVIRAPSDGICSTDIWVVRAKDEVDQDYLYYCMALQQFIDFVTAGSEGTKMPRAIWEYASRYNLLLPPLQEQRAIAHVLGTLDDKIELNRRMNETLEAMARALFKSWFVDFYPVRAKMDGRWHPGESLPGLPAEHYDLFPDRLVDSELGEIPEGWETKALGDLFVAENVRLGSVDVPEYSCTNEGLIPRSDRFKKKLSMSNSKNKVISKGDFVFGLSRRVLNFGLMRDGIGCVSPAYRTYSTNQDLVIPDLLERMMRLHSEYFYLAVSASSREGQSISQDALYGLKVSLPTIAIQHHLNHFLKRISLRSAHCLKENDRLGILRDTLLPKLVSGEVRMGQE